MRRSWANFIASCQMPSLIRSTRLGAGRGLSGDGISAAAPGQAQTLTCAFGAKQDLDGLMTKRRWTDYTRME